MRCMDHQPLTSDEFHARYSGGSDVRQFKQGVSVHKIAEAVTASSNTGGGTVLIGIDPGGRPAGTNTDGEAEARIHRVVTRVHRPGRFTLHVLDVETVQVLAIVVSRRSRTSSRAASRHASSTLPPRMALTATRQKPCALDHRLGHPSTGGSANDAQGGVHERRP